MLSILFVAMFVLCGVKSQVLFSVLPAIVEPGLTPFFTLSCSVTEQETGQIQTLTIYRRAITARQAKVNPRETIAQLKGPAPGQVIVSPQFANVTARGQLVALEVEIAAGAEAQPPRPLPQQTPQQTLLAIQQQMLAAQQAEFAAQQAEFGTYLDITFPNPTIEDLGFYVCEATILGIGSGQTLFAEVSVTTSNPLTDRLLLSVSEIQQQTDLFNRTLTGVQAEIDSINAALSVFPRLERDLNAQRAAVTDSTDGTTNTTITGSTDSPTSTTSTGEDERVRPTKPAGEELKKLTSVLLNLDAKFHKFNKTLERLNKIIAKLEERVERTSVKTAAVEQADLDAIRHYFTLGNASFILFETKVNASSDRAQAECESRRHHLAEINNAEDFQSITNEIATFVSNDSLVLVSGQRKLGQNEWVFQNSQHLVNFFALTPAAEQAEPTDNECLALSRPHNDWNTVQVPCASENDRAHFLCQRNANVA